MRILATRLKQRRTELQLSQGQLALMAETSPTQISRYETDAHEPCAETITALAKVLGVSADWLLGLDDAPQPAPFSELADIEQWLVNIYRTKSPESQKKLVELAKIV